MNTEPHTGSRPRAHKGGARGRCWGASSALRGVERLAQSTPDPAAPLLSVCQRKLSPDTANVPWGTIPCLRSTGPRHQGQRGREAKAGQRSRLPPGISCRPHSGGADLTPGTPVTPARLGSPCCPLAGLSLLPGRGVGRRRARVGTAVMDWGLPEPRRVLESQLAGPRPTPLPQQAPSGRSHAEPARAEFHKVCTDLEPVGKQRAVQTKRPPRLSHTLSYSVNCLGSLAPVAWLGFER